MPIDATNYRGAAAGRQFSGGNRFMVKLWRGGRHTVIALPYGFRYQGKIYRSLIAIAREITGTHCNGAISVRCLPCPPRSKYRMSSCPKAAHSGGEI